MTKLLRRAIVLFILMLFTSTTQAQFGYPCELQPPTSRGIRFHQHLRVNVHSTNETVSLIDAQTRAVYHILETGVRNVNLLGWSPSCRYVAAFIHQSDNTNLYIWDVETGSQMVYIARNAGESRGYGPVATVNWSPDERYAIFNVWFNNRRAGLLVDIPNGTFARIPPLLRKHAWDVANNRLYGIGFRERDGVFAFELPTGQLLATYAPENPDERILAQELFLSDDRSHIVYYTAVTYSAFGCRGGFAVWNVWTVSGQTVQTDCRDFPSAFRDGRRRIVLSPDNRYVVVGRDIIRVWDLQALNSDSSPNWFHEGPEYRIAYIRFLDNQTLETFAVGEHRYALRWNLFSGAYVNAYDHEAGTEVNRDGSPLNP
jgi:WD40 repeat protein